MKEKIKNLIEELKSLAISEKEKDELFNLAMDLLSQINKVGVVRPLDGTSDNPPHKPPNP